MKLPAFLQGIVTSRVPVADHRERAVGDVGMTLDGACVIGSVPGRRRSPLMIYDGTQMPVFACGAADSHKTAGLVIPTLLSWRESAVVLDLHGDIAARTATWRADVAGNRILPFDVASATSPQRYNPLDAVRIEGPEAVEDARHLAGCLVDDTDSDENHWGPWAHLALVAWILREATLGGSLGRLVASISDDALFRFELTHHEFALSSASVVEVMQDTARAFRKLGAEARDRIRATVIDRLGCFLDPQVAKNTSVSTFELEELLNGVRPATLYLGGAMVHVERLRGPYRVLLEQIVRRAGESWEPSRRVLLMLDDCCSLGRLRFVEDAAALARSPSVKLYCTLQDTGQMQMTASAREVLLRRAGWVVVTRNAAQAPKSPWESATRGQITDARLNALGADEALIWSAVRGEVHHVRLPSYFHCEPFKSRATLPLG